MDQINVKEALKAAGYKGKQLTCLVDMIGETIHEESIKFLRYRSINVCGGVNIYTLMDQLGKFARGELEPEQPEGGQVTEEEQPPKKTKSRRRKEKLTNE